MQHKEFDQHLKFQVSFTFQSGTPWYVLNLCSKTLLREIRATCNCTAANHPCKVQSSQDQECCRCPDRRCWSQAWGRRLARSTFCVDRRERCSNSRVKKYCCLCLQQSITVMCRWWRSLKYQLTYMLKEKSIIFAVVLVQLILSKFFWLLSNEGSKQAGDSWTRYMHGKV